MQIRRALQVAALLVAVLLVIYQSDQGGSTTGPSRSDSSELFRAIDTQASNRQVSGQGVVTRILSDDNDGSRHQRFIVELASNTTVLIAHNIDLAPRVADLRVGDRVEFFGEYEWNSRGGVVHWTHRASNGGHPHGWIRHDGRQYD